MHTDCFFCHIRTLEKQIKKFSPDETTSKKLIGAFIDQYEVLEKHYNPFVAAKIHELIRKFLKIPDPYLHEKEESNRTAAQIVSHWANLVETSNNRPLNALKLALAANIIDFGPGHDFDIEKDIAHLYQKPLGINHSAALFDAAGKANNILYLADNAGEIIFDKLFLKQLNHSGITVAVRGFPVINDATMQDAEFAQIHKVANVIQNGNDAPSTLLDRCSKEFLEHYKKADVIIAKGQGNFEGLMFEKDPRIWFALVAKCDVIAKVVGIEKGETALVNGAKTKPFKSE